MTRALEILHSDGADSVVIADSETHDDIAEVFHNERHTVNQTVEQALATARLFTAAPDLLEALSAVIAHFDSERPDKLWMETERICRLAHAKATGAA